MKPAIGGVAEFLATIARSLTKYYKVFVLTNVPGCKAEDAIMPYEIERIPISRSYNKFDHWIVLRKIKGLIHRVKYRWNVPKLIKAVLKISPDHILIGSLEKNMVLVGTEIYKKKIPYSLFIHGLDFGTNGRSKAGRNVVVQARHIFVNSHFTANLIKQKGICNTSLNVIYPPVVPEDWDAAEENKEIFSSIGIQKNRYVLTIGRMIPRKGFDKVIRVLPELLKTYPDLTYVICGKKTVYTESLRKEAARIGVEHQVKFFEAPAGDFSFRKALLKNCLFHVMPTRAEPGGDVEGFGITYMEAALFSKPSIAGQTGGCAEAVINGETGAVIDGCDRNALMQTMMAWLASPQKIKTLGNCARQRAIREFSADTVASKLAALLD